MDRLKNPNHENVRFALKFAVVRGTLDMIADVVKSLNCNVCFITLFSLQTEAVLLKSF